VATRTEEEDEMAAAPTLEEALLPFQREGLTAAVERWDGRILLGDEMGLGKTIQV
jgi:SNF2 family DNA or RNA helicase